MPSPLGCPLWRLPKYKYLELLFVFDLLFCSLGADRRSAMRLRKHEIVEIGRFGLLRKQVQFEPHFLEKEFHLRMEIIFCAFQFYVLQKNLANNFGVVFICRLTQSPIYRKTRPQGLPPRTGSLGTRIPSPVLLPREFWGRSIGSAESRLKLERCSIKTKRDVYPWNSQVESIWKPPGASRSGLGSRRWFRVRRIRCQMTSSALWRHLVRGFCCPRSCRRRTRKMGKRKCLFHVVDSPGSRSRRILPQFWTMRRFFRNAGPSPKSHFYTWKLWVCFVLWPSARIPSFPPLGFDLLSHIFLWTWQIADTLF